MAERYPEVNDLGLVIPPVFDDCNPETCALTNRGIECRMSDHHVYWPRRDYKTPTRKAFRLRPENILAAPRCEHNTYHRKFTVARMPEREVMLRFIQESKLLESLGVLSKTLATQLEAFEHDEITDAKTLDQMEAGLDRQAQLALEVVRFELIPEHFVYETFTRYDLYGLIGDRTEDTNIAA